ncbi:hypothetical protein GCM10010109_79110 [Actinoplanes campanulatus]|nr:hypothetical protein GCM10010109_79110 [Actinoplanes campanulatus]GID41015.1 hypothetical protein Aca09nite_75210 [Actinoplanes campanulatus]
MRGDVERTAVQLSWEWIFAAGRESCLNAVDTALGAGRTTDLSPEGRGTGGTGQTLAWSGGTGDLRSGAA